MEVVILCIAERDQEANGVDECCTRLVLGLCPCPEHVSVGFEGKRTPSRGVLAHEPLLVPSKKAAALRLRRWAARKLLVEADDLVHANSIGGGADGLSAVSATLSRCLAWAGSVSGGHQSARRAQLGEIGAIEEHSRERLTFGEAICATGLGHCETRRRVGGAYLGGDQGRETTLLDEAHRDGCSSISINWPLELQWSRLGRRT